MKLLVLILSLLVSSTSMAAEVYKILTETQFESFQESGVFEGSSHDIRDGFIHMARSYQVERVVEKYFTERPVYLVGYSEHTFGRNLKYEAASNGDLFPHIFNQVLRLDEAEIVIQILK